VLLQPFLVGPKLIKSSQELLLFLLLCGVSVVSCLLANEVELSKILEYRRVGLLLLLLDHVVGLCAA